MQLFTCSGARRLRALRVSFTVLYLLGCWDSNLWHCSVDPAFELPTILGNYYWHQFMKGFAGIQSCETIRHSLIMRVWQESIGLGGGGGNIAVAKIWKKGERTRLLPHRRALCRQLTATDFSWRVSQSRNLRRRHMLHDTFKGTVSWVLDGLKGLSYDRDD